MGVRGWGWGLDSSSDCSKGPIKYLSAIMHAQECGVIQVNYQHILDV